MSTLVLLQVTASLKSTRALATRVRTLVGVHQTMIFQLMWRDELGAAHVTCVPQIPRVAPNVHGERALELELLGAVRTPEVPHISVRSDHVLLDARALVGTVVAQLAGVRFLASVYPHMSTEVGLACELLAAVLTRVWFLARVSHLVQLQRRRRVEELVAVRTLQVVRMTAQVLQQLLLAEKCLGADITQVRVLFNVLVQVDRHLAQSRQLLVTKMTSVFFSDRVLLFGRIGSRCL